MPACCSERPSTTRTACRRPGSASTTRTQAGPAAAATPSAELTVSFTLDGRKVEVARDGISLLEALREDLGVRSVKDGCSPQGQCGCCTVVVDGAARVACVTPVRRVAGRSVLTVDGLPPSGLENLAGAFVEHGASQCGFCTPGILCRLATLGPAPAPDKVETALLAHLCRCTGWRTVVEAACAAPGPGAAPPLDQPGAASTPGDRRATIEGATTQRTGAGVVLGRGGFADDTAPEGCLVAVPDPDGGWSLGETLAEARAASGKVQGRRSGRRLSYPIEVPPGDWDVTLQTTWVEPGYLETDASWCMPGGEPAHPAGNGGAFGGKVASPAPAASRELADRHGRPVRVVFSREDVVRLGPKRPPVAAGVRAGGSGVMRIASAPGVAAVIAAVAPGMELREVVVAGPRVSPAIRAAGWAEACVLLAAGAAVADGTVPGAGAPAAAIASAVAPGGGRATARVTVDGQGAPTNVHVRVSCGEVLSPSVLRSYVTGAAHMALGWVCSEAIAVDEDGVPEDLTIRSFGILRARDTPPITVDVDGDARDEPVNGSDAAFAAVAAATWIAQGLPPRWPTRRGRIA
ncbi:MAG: 2Fe-2S iron-sulfur cluster-binding protein [Acidimicrobiales bacterium]